MKDEAADAQINPYELLAKNPESTFFLRAGVDMPEFGISDGDYIVVDRYALAHDGKLVIAALEDELRIMKLRRSKRSLSGS